MQRILMRLGKSPFDPKSGLDTLERNYIGGNNGNLIFGAASHKLLSTNGVEVVPNYYRIDASMAPQVNDEYDGFVLPLANAFRPSFEQELKRTTQLIEQLKIPFIMLSGGAQLSIDGSFDALRPIESSVKAFCRAVLDKSSAITVRGERTAEYLNSLGFEDVLVVGCPSLTMFGRDHHVDKTASLRHAPKVAYNIQTPDPFLGQLIQRTEAEYDSTYFPQNLGSLELMVTGIDPYRGKDLRLPLDRRHAQFTERRAEFHLDAYSWIDRLRGFDFSFGPRIHGNIAAALAGTPAVVVAHDARTRELADYHEIPFVMNDEKIDHMTVEELFELANYDAFNSGHGERFDRLVEFVKDNGFNHIYETDQRQARSAYEEKVARTDFFGPQMSNVDGSHLSHDELLALSNFRDRKVARNEQVQGKRIAALEKRIGALSK